MLKRVQHDKLVSEAHSKNLYPYAHINLFTFRKAAFTLAEVLITLVIIGVVATLTIPMILSNIQDKIYKSAFKKQYSVFSQAMQRVYLDEGVTYTNIDWRMMPVYLCQLQKHLKVVDSGLNCSEVLSGNFDLTNDNYKNKKFWHEDYKWFDKSGKPMAVNNGYLYNTVLLQDGSFMLFHCTRLIFVDVNGYAKPNTVGRDIFYFNVNTTGLYFFPTIANECTCPSHCTQITADNYIQDCETASGWGC